MNPRKSSSNDRIAHLERAKSVRYPESKIDSFSRQDTTVEFYTRVGALLEKDMTVLDFGAGRGEWFFDNLSETRRRLRDFRGRVARIIAMDVDDVVLSNPTADDAYVITVDSTLPLEDESVDLIVADFTFEHVDDPAHTCAELARIVRPGGWICARTPNKYGYIGLGARLVPNKWHVAWLKWLQPSRKGIDVFPVRYKLNTRRDLARYFPAEKFNSIVYTMAGEPSYAGSSRVSWSLFSAAQRLQPRSLDPLLAIFVQKRET